MARKLTLSGNKRERSVREEHVCNGVARAGVKTRRAVPLRRDSEHSEIQPQIGPNRIMFLPNRTAYLNEQFRFVLLAPGDKDGDMNPILFRLFPNSSGIRFKNYAFEDTIFGSTSR
jgi:hypothetical protein